VISTPQLNWAEQNCTGNGFTHLYTLDKRYSFRTIRSRKSYETYVCMRGTEPRLAFNRRSRLTDNAQGKLDTGQVIAHSDPTSPWLTHM